MSSFISNKSDIVQMSYYILWKNTYQVIDLCFKVSACYTLICTDSFK